ncbi:MAG TPA: S1 RNA-binding domain-containing protein [Byssovorax sp.]|jgi:small subunit ribosomal protein S1
MGKNDESFASLFEQTRTAKTGDRRYTPGDRIEVTVVAIAREAVFADLGGKQEGMFERVELADEDGALHVAIGSRVTAVVRGVDFATGQVRLSPVAIRKTAEDAPTAVAPQPGQAAAVVEGARVKGKVTGVERYGVFVQVAGTHGRNGRGLVPTAETGTARGADLKKHFAVGQDVEAKIVHVDAETGRVRMSISAIAGDDERRDYESFKATGEVASGDAPDGAAPAKGKRGKQPAPRSFGTLGDLLKKPAPKR